MRPTCDRELVSLLEAQFPARSMIPSGTAVGHTLASAALSESYEGLNSGPGHGVISRRWSVGDCRRLRNAEGPNSHLRKGQRSLAEPIELGKISAGLDDVDLGVCPDVREAEVVNLAEQRSALREGQARERRLRRRG